MRILIVLWFLIVSSEVVANPLGCAPLSLKSQDKQITLPGTANPKTSMIYVFHNKSLQSLWIDHPVQNPGASAGWSSFLRSEHWSAIVINKKNFAVRCAMIQPGKVVYLDCAHSLTICAPDTVTTHKPLEGNYWLAEDKDWKNFVALLNKKGIRLK